MPGYDRTGPSGQGAMTGGGRGNCSTNSNFQGINQGLYRSRKFCRGNRNQFYATGLTGWQRGFNNGYRENTAIQEDISTLKDQAQLLRQQLENINNRINEAQKTTSNEEN